MPQLGILSDKLRAPGTVFAWQIRILFPLFLLIPVLQILCSAAVVPIAVLASLLWFGVLSGNSVMDSWNGAELEKIGVQFSASRWCGSFGAAVIGIAASMVVGPVLPAWSCCVLIPLVAAPLFFLVRKQKAEAAAVPVKQKETVSSSELLKLVFKNYYFIAYLLMYLGFSTFVSTVHLSLSYLMDYVGAQRSSVGVISSTRAAVEIFVMLWLVKSKKRPANWILLAAANLMIAVEYLLYPSMTSLGQMTALCLMSGIGGGLIYGVGINHVLQIVDHRANSTAVSIMGMCNAAVGIIGSTVGGTVIDRFGIITLTNVVGVLNLMLTSMFAVFSILGRVVWKKKYVNEGECV